MQAECQKNQCLKRAQEENGLYFFLKKHTVGRWIKLRKLHLFFLENMEQH